MTSMISVAIATMNRPGGLARCLDAILAGSLLPAEIIVVDQGHGDGAYAVTRQRRTAPVPIRYVAQAPFGLSASRNAAAEQARGDILAVIDDDCVPDAGWIAAVSAAFASAPHPDAVTGRVLALGSPRAGTFPIALRTSTCAADFVSTNMPWEVGTGANFAIRLGCLGRAGGYDERLGAGSPGLAGEDLELAHRLLRLGARIRYEPAAVVYHERQSHARRLATRRSYGYGIGAMCGLLLRRGESSDAMAVLWKWLSGRGMRAARGAVRGDVTAVHHVYLSLVGTAAGLAYGCRMGRRSRMRAGGTCNVRCL
jgi:glycosyltransferase involved in cell wall biosynthesis